MTQEIIAAIILALAEVVQEWAEKKGYRINDTIEDSKTDPILRRRLLDRISDCRQRVRSANSHGTGDGGASTPADRQGG